LLIIILTRDLVLIGYSWLLINLLEGLLVKHGLLLWKHVDRGPLNNRCKSAIHNGLIKHLILTHVLFVLTSFPATAAAQAAATNDNDDKNNEDNDTHNNDSDESSWSHTCQ
jgi:hypothetical protein